MKQWLKQLRNSFGLPFLWLICLIYFTQGFRTFVWTAISYQLKDRLKLSPSASQFLSSVVIFPWSIKPLYGILSDCIPIRGRKRIPYLILASIFSLFPWLLLGLNTPLMDSKMHLTIFLTIQNLGSAMADVVVDAMIAEAARFERAAFSGDLQSLSWLAMAIGGLCGSLLGGYALNKIEIASIFLLFSLLPSIQLLSCGLVKENPPGNNVFHSGSSKIANGDSTDPTGLERSRISTQRRKKNRTSSKKGTAVTSESQVSKKDGSLVFQRFCSLKMATYCMCSAFKQPIILRPMAWFFLAHVSVPNLSTVMFYYQTEFLNLDASFLGTVRVVGWLGLMFGTFIYNRFLKEMRLRRILMLAHAGYSFMSVLNIALVFRMNVAFGISDQIMVLFGSAFLDAIHQFKFMPFLILSGRLCPPGIEGTLFAMFMSINNFGTAMGSLVGAGLASFLNITSSSFDNFPLGLAIQVICTFIPVAFLFLIPEEATGV